MRVDGQEPDIRRQRRTSGQRIAKSISIKDAKRRSGNCARKATELTPGGLRRVPSSELREPRGDLTAAQKSAEGILGGAICRRPERMEVGSRNAHLDGAMRQNTGSVRPARQDRRVKPDGAVMQGPKRPRRCSPPNPGGHPSCGNRCLLNPPNRRIRTRMYGGVGGEEPRGSPLSRSMTRSGGRRPNFLRCETSIQLTDPV